MKKILTFAIIFVLAFSLMMPCTAFAAQDNLLRIYSWEDYIYTDEDTGKTLADDFVDWYKQKTGKTIRVEYSTFGTNEIMYNELKISGSSSGYSYDLICPSEYMIQKMIKENMLEEYSAEFLDESNPENYYINNVSGYIKNLFESHKTENGKSWANYAAGYMWGTMGFIFNPDKIDANDIAHWKAVWDEKYKNQSTLKDSVRDTYFMGLAYVYSDELTDLATQFKNGELTAEQYNKQVNTILNRTDDETIDKVEDALKQAKNNVFGFEVDSGKNDMITGKININFAWSGDAVYAMDEAEAQNVYLDYSVPVEGSNIFFDGWVMPKGANTKLAEAFVNYISMPENACANMDYIGYTSVIAGDDVFDRMVDYFELTTADDYATLSADEQAELTAVDLSYFFDDLSDGRSATVYTDVTGRQFYAQYPDLDTINRCAIMNYFDSETNEKISVLWENVKGTELPVWVLILLGALIVGYFGKIIAKKVYKSNRAKYILQTKK